MKRFIFFIFFCDFLHAVLECKEWCSNPCEELTGNVGLECGACDKNDPRILCFGDGSGNDRSISKSKRYVNPRITIDKSIASHVSHEDTTDILNHCNLERVHMADVSRSILLKAEKPFLIVNATRGWSAHEKWTRENFLSEHGEKAFSVSPSGPVTVSQMMKVSKYHMGHVLSSTDCYSEPWRPYTPFLTSLHADYKPPEAFKPYSTFQIGVGVTKGTGVPPEQHPSSWFAVVAGPKRWAIHPPDIEEPPELMNRRKDQGKICSASKTSKHTLFCTQKEGDVIWIPNYWWHETCNLQEHSIGMGALTYENCCDIQTPEHKCVQPSHEPGISFNVDDIEWCKMNECPTLHKGRLEDDDAKEEL